MFSLYYRAVVFSDSIWLLTGFIRSAEGCVFERTLDGTGDVLEFFVSPDYQQDFEMVMKFFQNQQIVAWYKQMPNRLEIESFLIE